MQIPILNFQSESVVGFSPVNTSNRLESASNKRVSNKKSFKKNFPGTLTGYSSSEGAPNREFLIEASFFKRKVDLADQRLWERLLERNDFSSSTIILSERFPVESTSGFRCISHKSSIVRNSSFELRWTFANIRSSMWISHSLRMAFSMRTS